MHLNSLQSAGNRALIPALRSSSENVYIGDFRVRRNVFGTKKFECVAAPVEENGDETGRAQAFAMLVLEANEREGSLTITLTVMVPGLVTQEGPWWIDDRPRKIGELALSEDLSRDADPEVVESVLEVLFETTFNLRYLAGTLNGIWVMSR